MKKKFFIMLLLSAKSSFCMEDFNKYKNTNQVFGNAEKMVNATTLEKARLHQKYEKLLTNNPNEASKFLQINKINDNFLQEKDSELILDLFEAEYLYEGNESKNS